MTERGKVNFDGDGAPRLAVEGNEAINECIERLFLACRRSIMVRAKRLDFDFYFSEALTECCRSLVARDMHNELLFLIEDDKYLMWANSRLVALARQFSSYIRIRVIPEEYIERHEMFIVQAAEGCLHQPNTDQARGLMSTSDPGMARQLTTRFKELWERSPQPPELFVTGL